MELARLGELGAHPNPMVGAVIVDRSTGLIVGEGWHRHWGEGHAEVNAVADADARGADLSQCDIYVTLEPCAHWGKTPPCAKLIIDRGIHRVIVGCVDPFSKVEGRGIEMMREAGVEVIMAPESLAKRCRALNPMFMTAHVFHRPYVILKWARSADGFIDWDRDFLALPAAKLSTPLTTRLVHRIRAEVDAIAVGSRTERLDHPRLDCRFWPDGRAPRRVKFNRRENLGDQLQRLYDEGITSLLIEGGTTLINSFIFDKLWDLIRVETAPVEFVEGIEAPAVPPYAIPVGSVRIGENELKTYKNSHKIGTKGMFLTE